jgi:L-threonylcarbamoyladenylate synthase
MSDRPTPILLASDASIARAAALIAAGQPVAVPTETVYGLAADATNPRAVAAIYEAKGRPSFNPLIIHVLDIEAAAALAVFDDDACKLASAFWPGPLTLVLPRRADCPVASLATAGLPTIAIRVPAHPVMRALLKACKVPLAAPSANASGFVSATTAEHVASSLGGRIPLIIDGGACQLGLESTIVAVGTGAVRVLRPGMVTTEMIQHALGVAPETSGGSSRIEAPGQLASHYAPSKPLRLNVSQAAPDEYLIGFGNIAGDFTLSASGDLNEAAAALFDALHRADHSEKPKIAVAPIPEQGLGVAINDRLRRAAA